MSLKRRGTDWIQKNLLVRESNKSDSKMKIDIKKYLWRQTDPI